jgi:RNA polymerase sigma factor (sigma-70 family)
MKIEESWAGLVSRLEADLRARAAGDASRRDDEAWESAARFLREYGRALSRTHPDLQQHDIDDLAQDVLLKLQSLRTLQRLKAAGSPAGYLAVMLRNAATDLLRQRQRRIEQAVSDELPAPDTSEAETAVSNRLRKALHSLGPEERNLLRMRFWRSLSIAQIAEASNSTYSATAVRLFRLLHKLRELLQRANGV